MAFIPSTSTSTASTASSPSTSASSAQSSPSVSRSNSGIFHLHAPGQQSHAEGVEFKRPAFILRGPTPKKSE